MKFPIDEAQIATIVDKCIPNNLEDNRGIVMDAWRGFIPVINQAYERGRHDALKELEKGGVKA